MTGPNNPQLIGKQLVSVNKMYYPEIGGVEVVAQRIAEFGTRLFNRSVVITFNRGNRTVEENINGVHIIRLGSFLRRDPIRLSTAFPRTIRNYDNVETLFLFHFPSVQSELYLAHSNVEGKKICFYHSDIVGRGTVGSFYNRYVVPHFLSKMDRIVVTSPNMVQTSECIIPFSEKVDVVPLFADIHHFQYREENKRMELLAKLNASYDARIVLYIGRFGRYKGLDYLVKAMALLPDNYYLVLIGSGPEKEKIEMLVSELNLTHRVLRLDHVPYDDLPKYYSSADVFVLPSVDRGEAFGLVAVEAMACGVPVVTTELGTGTSFHNIDGVTGHVVPPRSEKALAEAIVDIVENKDKFNRETIRHRAEEFSTEKFEERILQVFREVLGMENG